MNHFVPAGFALALGLAALAGCVPPPPPPAEVAVVPPPAPPPLPPVALAAPVAVPVEVPVMRRRHPAHLAHTAPHHVVHRHFVRRTTVMRTTYAPVWSPQCGSVSHACDVDHTAAPIE
jgi:hypothetical protein